MIIVNGWNPFTVITNSSTLDVAAVLDLPLWTYIKKKLHKCSDGQSRDMLNFEFVEKGLGLVSPPHVVYDFSRQLFLMLYARN